MRRITLAAHVSSGSWSSITFIGHFRSYLHDSHHMRLWASHSCEVTYITDAT